MFRNKSVSAHHFAMVPRADIPRSSFRMETAHKTTFDAGYLVPVFCEEVLPGDSWSVKMTAFTRMSTPLYPLMDNLHLDSFFFFVPYRLVWSNWKKFMGEQVNPGDSISYTIPQATCPAGGYAVNSLQDYFGLGTVGQMAGGQVHVHSNLPLRAYNLIYNEWFRDENLQNSVTVDLGDGPDTPANYVLKRRGKRHDYFTSALPWPQKGATSVSIPLGTSAAIRTQASELVTGVQQPVLIRNAGTGAQPAAAGHLGVAAAGGSVYYNAVSPGASSGGWYPTNLYADLSTATAATINQLRQSFQIQKLLERDARGGTRYTEIVRAHFGVISPDQRLQRPEYLGGGSSRIVVNPVAQNSGTGQTGQTTPLGHLGAIATGVAMGHGFTQSFTEHGVIIGLVNVRADLTYQQGLRRMWGRSTRYDFYFPAFAMLGEQAIWNYEIWLRGDGQDNNVFGYQERWAEYRYIPPRITGLFRSTAAGTLDGWHAAQNFAARPTLNSTFIEENPPMDRILAVASQTGKHFLFDSFFSCRTARPLPLYSVPGLIDHF